MLVVLMLVFAGCVTVSLTAESRGEVWPKPRSQIRSNVLHTVNIETMKFVIENPSNIISLAVERCKKNIQILQNIAKKYRNIKTKYSIKKSFRSRRSQHTPLATLNIAVLERKVSKYPYFNMDESYSLNVATTSVLSSGSVWGAIRGLETFSQLCYLTRTHKLVVIKETSIVDYPHYPHRGLMLDTSRHFISVNKILKTLDAMAMNKLNVFHWHIVDDQSFPYVSKKFPELSDKGAYLSTMIYDKSDIETIREYAKDRGIRVLIEIDMPGHTGSWRHSHPEIMTTCGSYAPMNPLKTETYNLIKPLVKEVQTLFPDDHFHLGGDEVNYGCWASDPKIKAYMKSHKKTTGDLLSLFFHKVVSFLKTETTPIFWEEVFDANIPLPRETVVQVWKGSGKEMMTQVLKSGIFGLQSAPYYLNYLHKSFDDYYSYEPRLRVKREVKNCTLLKNLIGGEACMWGEKVDDNNLLSTVWPRASAVAEVLWSLTNEHVSFEVARRIREHTCRMVRRGIPAQPYGPGYCVR